MSNLSRIKLPDGTYRDIRDVAANAKITAAQTKIAWVDEFEWTDEQVWPEKSGGGGGDTKALRTMPTLRVLKSSSSSHERMIYVSHPMMNDDGAEIVLMRYAKKNGKLRVDENDDITRIYKKGYGLACGQGHSAYFTFSAETTYDDFVDFCEEYLSGGNMQRHFGIALRIPNPDYAGPRTALKNATYKGVPESLYSDVLPVTVFDLDSWGIGIK